MLMEKQRDDRGARTGMSQKLLCLTYTLVAGITPLADAAAGTVYRALKQFSIKANPNAVWSYVYSGGLLPDTTNMAQGVKV